jgi:hypothetical protein
MEPRSYGQEQVDAEVATAEVREIARRGIES